MKGYELRAASYNGGGGLVSMNHHQCIMVAMLMVKNTLSGVFMMVIKIIRISHFNIINLYRFTHCVYFPFILLSICTFILKNASLTATSICSLSSGDNLL